MYDITYDVNTITIMYRYTVHRNPIKIGVDPALKKGYVQKIFQLANFCNFTIYLKKMQINYMKSK